MDATLEMLQRIDKGIGSLTTKYTDHETRFKAFDERFVSMDTRMQSIDERLKTSRTVTIGAEGNDVKKFSWSRAIMMMASKDWSNPEYGFEREVMVQSAKAGNRIGQSAKETRDLGGTTSDVLGGFLVPAEYVADLIEVLRAKVVVEQLGATTLDGLKGSPVEIPRQTGGATGFWVSEGADITSSDQNFGQVNMTPHEAAAITFVSNRLLRMGVPGVENLVRDDLAKTLARLEDLAALAGTGASNQPQGIFGSADVNVVSIDAVPTIDNLYNVIYEVELDNADEGALGWAMHPRTWNTLRQVKNSEGDYILSTSPFKSLDTARPAVKGTLLGYPFATTTQIPINLGGTTDESRLYFGNWADLMLGRWGGLELLASQEAGNAFARNQTFIRVIHEVDVALRHGQSFCTVNDVRA